MRINVKEREELARSFFREGYNCTQSVIFAFSDIIGIDRDSLAGLVCGLGGGVGRMREVCGTVSAMAMISGCLTKKEPGSISIYEQKKLCYALVQSLSEKFKEDNGSIICRDLLDARIAAKKSHVPEERTESYYKNRPCEELVGYMARIIAERIESDESLSVLTH